MFPLLKKVGRNVGYKRGYKRRNEGKGLETNCWPFIEICYNQIWYANTIGFGM